MFSISPELRHREYDSSGALASFASILQESGFHEKQFVQRRGDKVIAQIVEFQHDHVKLHVEEEPITGYAQVSAASFLVKKEWKPLSKTPVAPEEVTDWAQFKASDHVDVKVHLAKAAIFQKLVEMEKKHQKTYDGLKIFVKPQRSVVASKPFSKGKLTLVPTTLKIEVKYDGDDPKEPGNHVCLGRAGHADLSFYLLQCFNAPTQKKEGGKTMGFVSPYWCVRPTRDPDEANCEKSGEFSPTDGNSSLMIPTIRNSKDISVGDTLLLYVPKIDKTPMLEDFQHIETGGKRRKLLKTSGEP